MSNWSDVIELQGSDFFPSQDKIWTRNSRSLNYTSEGEWIETQELPSDNNASSGQVGYRVFHRTMKGPIINKIGCWAMTRRINSVFFGSTTWANEISKYTPEGWEVNLVSGLGTDISTNASWDCFWGTDDKCYAFLFAQGTTGATRFVYVATAGESGFSSIGQMSGSRDNWIVHNDNLIWIDTNGNIRNNKTVIAEIPNPSISTILAVDGDKYYFQKSGELHCYDAYDDSFSFVSDLLSTTNPRGIIKNNALWLSRTNDNEIYGYNLPDNFLFRPGEVKSFTRPWYPRESSCIARSSGDVIQFDPPKSFGKIKGTVYIDEEKTETIEGVKVEIDLEGSSSWEDTIAETDVNGEFSLIAPAGTHDAIFSEFFKEKYIPLAVEETTLTFTSARKNKDLIFTLELVSLEIYTPIDLFNMRYHSKGHFILMNDLNLDGFVIPEVTWHDYSDYEEGTFPPIELLDEGSFDGQGFTISKLSIIKDSGNYIGLFGHVINGSVIKNTNLRDVYISGRFGYAIGTLLGEGLDNVSIIKCSAKGTIEIEDGAWNWGTAGLIGSLHNLFQNAELELPSCLISECYTDVDIIGTYMATGGILGDGNCELENCYARGDIIASETYGYYLGGLVGYHYPWINYDTTIVNCYSTGAVSNHENVDYSGGLIGFYGNNSLGVINSYYNSELSGQSDTGKGEPRTTEEMIYPHSEENTYIDWDFDNIWVIDDTKNNGYPILMVFPFTSFKYLMGSIDANSHWLIKQLIQQIQQIWAKHNGVYKPVKAYVKANGEYKHIAEVYRKINGLYKK